MDDLMELRGENSAIFRVTNVDRDSLKVTLEDPEGTPPPPFDEDSSTHPLLRRWDYQVLDPESGYPVQANDNALLIQEGEDLLLEDSIQITFMPAPKDERHMYRTGDYWLIPARTATGDVEWPGPANAPEGLPPHGVEHYYAPLAIVLVDATGMVTVTDCRCSYTPICVSRGEAGVGIRFSFRGVCENKFRSIRSGQTKKHRDSGMVSWIGDVCLTRLCVIKNGTIFV